MPSPSRGALAQTAAFSIATILGSGILGLPVSLARAGLPPFVFSFTLTLIAQVAIVYVTVELLQRASFAPRKGSASAGLSSRQSVEMLPYDSVSQPGDEWDDGGEREGSEVEAEEETAPGLHTFAELYLPSIWLKVLFETAVLFHFVSISACRALFYFLRAYCKSFLLTLFSFPSPI